MTSLLILISEGNLIDLDFLFAYSSNTSIIDSISFSRVFSFIEIEILELSIFKTLIFFDLKIEIIFLELHSISKVSKKHLFN